MLRFTGFREESVQESQIETRRVRKIELLYYLEDDTVQVRDDYHTRARTLPQQPRFAGCLETALIHWSLREMETTEEKKSTESRILTGRPLCFCVRVCRCRSRGRPTPACRRVWW